MACEYCDDKGTIYKPEDEKRYDELFDRYCDMGQFDTPTIERRVKQEVGFVVVPCPHCQAGDKAEKILNYLKENGETPFEKMTSDLGADIVKIVRNLVEQKKIKSREYGRITFMIRE